MYEWYEADEDGGAGNGAAGLQWADILEQWALVEADLQDHGVDVYAVRHSRSWRWLQARILGLLTVPPFVFYDPAGKLQRVPQTRLGLALDPPELPTEFRQRDEQGAVS